MTAEKLKEIRLKHNLSQSKIARLLNVHPAKVSTWEAGKALIPENYVDQLADLFKDQDDKSINNLLTNSGIRTYTHKTFSRKDDSAQLALEGGYNYTENLKAVKLDPTKPKAIALFAGCGGMSLGLKKAGYQVVGFAEIEKGFRDIYKANFQNTALLGTDVCEISNEELKEWRDIVGEIDLLAGGPPCQGFSLAGKRDVLDPRNRLYLDYIRIAEHLKPKVVLMENVRLLAAMRTPDGKWVKDDIKDKFDSIGYNVVLHEINAKEYGVPQSRERVLFIAVRKDLNVVPTIPEPTNGPKAGKPYRTFREATSDLEPLESGEKSKTDMYHFAVKHPQHVINMLLDIPEGETAHNNPNPLLRPTSGFNTTYKRIKWDEPSSTITTNFSMISGSRNVHPQYTRSLTTREALRSQTFPDDFKFVGTMGKIRASIGNAVPPQLAEVVAKHILENILNKNS